MSILEKIAEDIAEKISNASVNKALKPTILFCGCNTQVKKDMHRLTNIKYNDLSAAKQLEWNIQVTAYNVLKTVSSGDGVNIITKEIASNSNPDKLALEQTLKLFI